MVFITSSNPKVPSGDVFYDIIKTIKYFFYDAIKTLRIGFYYLIKTIKTWDFGMQLILKQFKNKVFSVLSSTSHYRFPNFSFKQHQLFVFDVSYVCGNPMYGYPMQHHGHNNRIETNNIF